MGMSDFLAKECFDSCVWF